MIVDNPDESVYRRGRVSKVNINRNPTTRDFKPRSQDEGKLSVNLKSLSTAIISVVDINRFNLFELKITDINDIRNDQGVNLFVEEDPIEDNLSHALINRIEPEDDETPLKLAEIAINATPE